MADGVIRSVALNLVKARLNRLESDTSLDGYLTARIEAAITQLTEIGIVPDETYNDMMLVVDLTVWQYMNRDSVGSMPEWLRLRRRERWLRQHKREADGDDS